jgi:hypothetical protein
MEKISIGFPCCKWPDEPKRGRYQTRKMVSRRTAPNEKGYTWTMGYNNIVGRYSSGFDYSRFSGSSYNRSLKVNTYAKDLLTITGDLIAMAAKLARKMFAIPGWSVSGPLIDFFSRPDIESARVFVRWLQSKIPGHVDGYSIGVHLLSPRSRGKIKDKATAFYRACPGSRVFVTLTFIAPVADRAGVVILNKFLTAIRAEFHGFNYLWVAERQQDTGNIHFHMLANKRLPVKRFNALWVVQQYNAGLIGHDRYGQAITRSEVDLRFQNGTMQKVLNPFDVKKVYGINGLSSYLTKYITKQKKETFFDCSVWHCSRGVSRLFTKATVSPSAFRYCQSFHNSRVDRETGELFPVPVVSEAFFVMVYINNKKVPLNFLREMEQANKWLMSGWYLDRLPLTNDADYKKYFLCEN